MRSFSREYKRVKYIPPPRKKGSKPIPAMFKDIPKREYYDDIVRLIHRGDSLWAVTSTFSKDKGILIDVFDFMGNLSDQFFLPIKGLTSPQYPSFHVNGNRLVVREMDEDDNPQIAVYKLQ